MTDPVAGKKRRPGRPARGEEAITRQHLLECALRAFAEKGYEAVSIRQLTRELGVSHNLIHHYFASKQKLWDAAVMFAADRLPTHLIESFDINSNDRSEIEGMYDVAYQVALMAAEHPHYFKILTDEAASGGDRFETLYNHKLKAAVMAVDEVYEQAVAKGVARPLPRGLLSSIFLAVITMPYNLKALTEACYGDDGQKDISVEERARAFVDLIFYGVGFDNLKIPVIAPQDDGF